MRGRERESEERGQEGEREREGEGEGGRERGRGRGRGKGRMEEGEEEGGGVGEGEGKGEGQTKYSNHCCTLRVKYVQCCSNDSTKYKDAYIRTCICSKSGDDDMHTPCITPPYILGLHMGYCYPLSC